MIDLHMHSTASDGTDDVHTLLTHLEAAGIKTFSLTDHDTIEGAMEMETIVPEGMTFFRGIEFSCITSAGKCHILGYGYNKDARAFLQILQLGRDKRRNKLCKRLDFLKERFGIEVSEQERSHLFCCSSVGKPQLGNLLVSMGLAAHRHEAIEKYIEPCKTESDRLDASAVIKAILAAGGIPVWAHPYGGTDEREVPRQKFEAQLRILLSAGLMGLECYYAKYTEAQIAFLVAAAKEHDLLISGGSDYHGANKTVALGTLNAEGTPVNEKALTIVPELVRRQREHPFHLIEIEKGHNPGACFWILPIKVHDVHLSIWAEDNLDCMDDAEISISESAFEDFLYLIFKRHFDNDLPENVGRGDEYLPNNYEDGIAFEWYLTENFYTFAQIETVLSDIRQVAALLRSDFDHPALDFLRAGIRNLHYYFLPLSFDTKYTEEEKEKIAKENIEHLIDFYVRFDASLREMIKVGRANGYRLISVCGP